MNDKELEQYIESLTEEEIEAMTSPYGINRQRRIWHGIRSILPIRHHSRNVRAIQHRA